MTGKPPRRKRHPKSDRIWPEPISDTFENVIYALVNSKTRQDSEWKFLNDCRQPDELRCQNRVFR